VGSFRLQENDDLLMTPFERNIEVWRQLWRVVHRRYGHRWSGVPGQLSARH